MAYYKIPYKARFQTIEELPESWRQDRSDVALDTQINRSFISAYEQWVSEEEKKGRRKPPRGVKIRADVPILQSKAEKERLDAVALSCGLDKNRRPIPKKRGWVAPDAVNDPAYIREILGDKKSSWEEL